MKQYLRYLFGSVFLFFAAPSTCAFGEVQILDRSGDTITITQKTGRMWQMDEEICVVREDRTIGCGNVIEASLSRVEIDLGSVSGEVRAGDRFRSYREISSESLSHLVMPSMGVEVGIGYWFPTLGVQLRLDQNWYLGIMGTYSKSTEDNKSISHKGFLISANHYSLQDPFPGFWFRVGAGAYFIDVKHNTSAETAAAPAILSTVGWRGFYDWFTFGAGVGAQYLPNKIQNTTLKLREISPLLTVDIGFRF